MLHIETRYEIMEGEDEGGFMPSGESEWTLEEAEAQLQKLRQELPELYRDAFICEVITTRISAVTPETQHELQTIPTAG
jgi:hypothetical protein